LNSIRSQVKGSFYTQEVNNMSAAIFAAGIFAHESGQRLLHILLKLGERGFRGLYEKCANNTSGNYYQTGLKRVSLWSESVLLEDIDYVKNTCPDMLETFEGCFSQYVVDRFQKKRSSHRCPPLVDFVRNFLESLGQHETLMTGEYFSKRDPMLTRLACMDAARQALYSLVTSENVRIELASEVGSVARSTTSSVHRGTSTHKTPIPETEEIRPDDSISQVGSVQQNEEEVFVPQSAPPTPRNPPSPVKTPSVVSKARVPPPTPVKTHDDSESVVSRHDFSPSFEDDPSHEELVVVKSTPPARSSTSSHHRQYASSRDSSVSIGVKQVKSPKH
jgi:hypothetical protein